jgi:hypothetical protein
LDLVQHPVTLDPIVILNIFAKTLPGSIAEVVVCWTAVGTAFESVAKSKGRITSIILGAVIATILLSISFCSIAYRLMNLKWYIPNVSCNSN